MRPPLSKELWFNTQADAAHSLVYKAWNGKERRLVILVEVKKSMKGEMV